MRVTLVSGAYPPVRSGVGDYTAQLAKALASASLDVSVVTSCQTPSHISHGVTVRGIVRRWNWSGIRAVADEVARLDPDLVHIQYPSWFNPDRTVAVHVLPALLRRAGRPVVMTMHEARQVRLRWLLRPLITSWLADQIIAVSECDQRRLRQMLLGKKIAFVPIGTNIPSTENLTTREAVRQSLGVTPDEIVVLYFGAARAATGIDNLLRTMRNLRREDVRYRLLLICDLDTLSENDYVAPRDARRVKALIEDLDLGNGLIRHGYAEPGLLSAYLYAADIGCFPYLNGASPQRGALLASLGHGLATITTPGVCLPSNYLHGENVWLVTPDDMHALYEGIVALGTQPTLRERLSAGAQTVAQTWHWNAIAQLTLDIYNSALCSKRS